MKHILMIAAENGALPGGKVGGIGDVLHDVPLALAKQGYKVSVVIPAYGRFAKLPGAKRKQMLKVNFAAKPESVALFHLSKNSTQARVKHYVLDHELFASCGAGKIYCDDPPGRPFASDAGKFALFCAAVAEGMLENAFGKVDVLHLHDWHAALLLVLRQYAPRYQVLRKTRCAFTIHNLALQGIRPFKGDPSSLQEWFPDLDYVTKQIADPRWNDCINPMAVGIRLADSVHAVSPSYAKEILKPSDASIGQYGGEGLEKDLLKAKREKRLFGILNGCEYPDKPAATGGADDWTGLVKLMRDLMPQWISRTTTLASTHFIASHALNKINSKRPAMLITSVGRITNQKIQLMRQPTSTGHPALHAMLDSVGEDALLILVGSGDADYEQFLTETMTAFDNFLFMRGYSDELANALYQQGDLFFMPSSFEPCGISQMLAMRCGQPCLVHQVGGLRDTVIDNKTGFGFSAKNLVDNADALVACAQRALTLYQNKPAQWQSISEAAAATRFEWADSIDAYLADLYQLSKTDS